jgi:hypothetical protein
VASHNKYLIMAYSFFENRKMTQNGHDGGTGPKGIKGWSKWVVPPSVQCGESPSCTEGDHCAQISTGMQEC